MKLKIWHLAPLLAVAAGLGGYGLIYRTPGAGAASNGTRVPPPVADSPVAFSWPVSARELTANLLEFAGPFPPGKYKGYSSLQSPDPVKMALSFDGGGNIRLVLYGRAGEPKEWVREDLAVFRFKGDPGTFVFRLPDGAFMYLKLEPSVALSSFPQAIDVYRGWLIRGRKSAKIVLIEEIHSSWPRVENLKELMPGDLPY